MNRAGTVFLKHPLRGRVDTTVDAARLDRFTIGPQVANLPHIGLIFGQC